MHRYIVTGFEPFGTHRHNPSLWAADACAKTLGAYPQTYASFAKLPVTYLVARLWAPSTPLAPGEVVVHFGLAQGRDHVCLERCAWPEHHDVADNHGLTPSDHPDFWQGAPTPRYSALPLERLELESPWPVRLSDDPGRYVCNATFYHTLGATERAVFVHIPPCDEPQAREIGRAFAQALHQTLTKDSLHMPA